MGGKEPWTLTSHPGGYRVYHAERPRQPGEPPLDFPEAYSRVAVGEADGLERAVRLTTHIDRPWQENLGVAGEDGARSAAIGDVIVHRGAWPIGSRSRAGRDGL